MHVCMYECMYVCMYVCWHVCMLVCMLLCMHACMYVYVHICSLDTLIKISIYLSMYLDIYMLPPPHPQCAYSVLFLQVNSIVFLQETDFLWGRKRTPPPPPHTHTRARTHTLLHVFLIFLGLTFQHSNCPTFNIPTFQFVGPDFSTFQLS